MRLIDADALIENFGKLTVELWLDSVEEAEIVSLIGNAPTIEPKRGEWNKPNYGQCSNCRGWAIETESGYYFSDFCPNCGCAMTKE